MTDRIQIDSATGTFLSGPYPAGDGDLAQGAEWIDVAPGWPDTMVLVPATRSFAPKPRTLTPREIVALYTPAERIRIFGSAVAEVRALTMMMQIVGEPIAVGSVEHVQGTALIAGLGLLDAPARAARIVAGLPPEAP